MQHKHFEACLRAHRNTSYVPEKRAESDCRGFDKDAANVSLWGGDLSKHETLFLKWIAAKSRCASSMITGPANFPTTRNQKANRAEENHARAYVEYLERLEKKHKEAEFYAANPNSRPIRSDDPHAMQRLSAKLVAAKETHAHLKANPAARRHSFDLQYALRNIREIERRIAYQQKLEAMPQPVAVIDGETLPYVVDGVGARVYFVFDGKPDEETRNLLKSRAFKWTPSKGHWGRMLTPNAIAAANDISKKIKRV